MMTATPVGKLGMPEAGDNPVGLDEWPTLCPVDATPEERRLRAASGRRKRLDAQLEAARTDEREAVLAAAAAGMKQVTIVAITGFTREYIRRMVKADREQASSA